MIAAAEGRRKITGKGGPKGIFRRPESWPTLICWPKFESSVRPWGEGRVKKRRCNDYRLSGWPLTDHGCVRMSAQIGFFGIGFLTNLCQRIP